MSDMAACPKKCHKPKSQSGRQTVGFAASEIGHQANEWPGEERRPLLFSAFHCHARPSATKAIKEIVNPSWKLGRSLLYPRNIERMTRSRKKEFSQ
jgi:hypothetical protein